jgi:cardiolipin synthase
MFAFPGFMLGNSDFPGADGFEVASWIFAIPGLVLSYYTGIAYIPLIRDGVTAGRQSTIQP